LSGIFHSAAETSSVTNISFTPIDRFICADKLAAHFLLFFQHLLPVKPAISARGGLLLKKIEYMPVFQANEQC